MLSLQQKNLCIWTRAKQGSAITYKRKTFSVFFSKGQVMDLSSRVPTYLHSIRLRLQSPFEIPGSSTLGGESSVQGNTKVCLFDSGEKLHYLLPKGHFYL